jgi:hypothetical protein
VAGNALVAPEGELHAATAHNAASDKMRRVVVDIVIVSLKT